jgi:hypothetical protein
MKNGQQHPPIPNDVPPHGPYFKTHLLFDCVRRVSTVKRKQTLPTRKRLGIANKSKNTNPCRDE